MGKGAHDGLLRHMQCCFAGLPGLCLPCAALGRGYKLNAGVTHDPGLCLKLDTVRCGLELITKLLLPAVAPCRGSWSKVV